MAYTSYNTPSKAPAPVPPKPATFIACGHQSPPGAAPLSSKEGVVFKEDTSMFTQPPICLGCHIANAKNQQQLIIDAYRCRIDAAENDIIERIIKIEDEGIRNEMLQTGKRITLGDIYLQRNAEIVRIWLTFSETWNFAERVKTIEVPGATPKKKGSAPKQVMEYLTILVQRTADRINVTGIWNTKEDQKVVETLEIMQLYS